LADSKSFAGYYCCFLPERCWDSSGERIVHDENCGSERVIMCVDTNTKKVSRIASAGDVDRKGVWYVVDVLHDVVVAHFSNPNSPPQLVS
jgi:hypothetical protein